MAQLIIIGTHQRICPLAARERIAFNPAMVQPALQALGAYADEGFIISTCNRVEIYLASPLETTTLEAAKRICKTRAKRAAGMRRCVNSYAV